VSRFVLDNTVTMVWCFAEEATAISEMLLRRLSDLADRALVPALWLYEVANVTELAVRKERITVEKAHTFFESLADLPIEIENPSMTQMFLSVRTLASQYRLTAYSMPLTLNWRSATTCRSHRRIQRW
jgi:predicted nucleic acid-binding protein